MLDQWVYQPGLPANVARPDPAAFAAVDQAVAAFTAGGAAPAAFDGWTTAERLRFLNSLPRKLPRRRGSTSSTPPSASTQAGNNEVLFAWLELALANRYDPAVPALEHFLTIAGAPQVRPAADHSRSPRTRNGAGRSPRASTPKHGRPTTR